MAFIFSVRVGTSLQRNKRVPSVQYLDGTHMGPEPDIFPPGSHMVVTRVGPPTDFPYPNDPNNGHFVWVRFDDGREELIWFDYISDEWFIPD
jgi:hypothetical protein